MTSPTRPIRRLPALLGAVMLAAGCTAPSMGAPPDRRTGPAGISAVDPRTCVSRPAIGGRPATTCDQLGP